MILKKDNEFEIAIIPNDNSYRYRAIMSENTIYLKFSREEYYEFPIGTYCEYEGQIYTLFRPQSVKKINSRNFEFELVLEGNEAVLPKYKFRNLVDGRLKFPLTAKPVEHIQMLVDNLNARGSGWTVGTVIDLQEKYIGYNHTDCRSALSLIAETFKTEFEISGKTIHLKKIEYNKSNPLALSYGKGNGFIPGIGRSNFEETIPIEILYVQGGERNIDYSVYGNKELLLPKSKTLKFDGEKFEDEVGFNESLYREYTTDPAGLYVKRADKIISIFNEDSLDLSEVYPSRIGTISAVTAVDDANGIYDFADSAIGNDLDFNNYLISGENISVVFQTGELAGRSFEIQSYTHAYRKFRITSQNQDGLLMPSGSFIPAIGDKYIIFNIAMPQSYISNDTLKTGASWDMYRQAVKYLYDNEDQKFSFSGELDGIWAKQNWLNIGGKIKLGGHINFSDNQFHQDGILLRIIGIKDYINRPHSPVLELSNGTVSGFVSTTLKKLEANEVQINETQNQVIQYSKRNFQSVYESQTMVESAFEVFSKTIGEAAIRAMDIVVGDEALQYQFVNNTVNPEKVAHNVTYNSGLKQLIIPSGIIQHLTLGIKSVGSKLPANLYKYWEIPAFTSAVLVDTEIKYYVYIKANKSNQNAEFLLSETPIELESVSGYYHFLLGLLNSQIEDTRDFVTMYGFTEILPGRITVDKVISQDGNNFFDFLNNAFRIGNNSSEVSFNVQGDSKLKIKGSVLQTSAGEEIVLGNYKGDYNPSATNRKGDEVSFTISGVTSTYYYFNNNPTSGIDPSNTTYWKLKSSGGGLSEGTQGQQGPLVIFRGDYNNSTNYYGITSRIDIVKYNDVYYKTKIGAGNGFNGVLPTNTTYWETFGGQFESVATNLLLAEGANIADWIIVNQKIQSQAQTSDETPRAKLDGQNGKIEFASDIERYTEANDIEAIKQTIKIDSQTGLIESRTSDNEVSHISSQGIFSNKAGIDAFPASTGVQLKGSIVGIGYGKMDKDSFGSNWGIAGLIGIARNLSTATNKSPAYGGWVENLFAKGLYLQTKVLQSTETLDETDVFITCIGNSLYDVIMPVVQASGNIKFIKNISTRTKTIIPGTNQLMFDNSTSDLYYSLLQGQQIMLVSQELSVDGVQKMCWIAQKN